MNELTNKILLVKYGEIALRGKNRMLYENMLMASIRRNLNKVGNFFVKKEQGRFLIEAEYGQEFDYEKAIPAVTNVFGVHSVCVGVKSADQNIETLKKLALEDMLQYKKNEQVTFKVDTTRAVKKYPILSNDVSIMVGGYLLENIPNLKVDVRKPQIRLKIELRTDAYIYSHEYKGLGGLPPNSSGKAVLLLSGGFDSPVAGFLTAKRGVEIKAVYFHSPPYTSERAKQKVKDLAERLAVFTGKIKLMIIPFTDIQLHLCDSVPPEKLTIFLKRAMIKTADKIAIADNAHALVMGDSIGQVASQTMQALKAVESATTLPIIRPLACMDKMEIMDIAQKIGTYDISILPYEDCCTLFVAEHPETKPKTSIIESIESGIENIDEMIDCAIRDAEIITF